MALSLSSLTQQLLGALSELPPDENPFTFISEELDAQLLPTLPPSAAKQLYFLASLFGLAGICILVSHVIRARKGIVWLYRWQSEYTIIRPHATLSWSTLAVIVVALFEVLIVRTIQLAKGDSRADFGYFLLLVWGSAWVAGSVATWSLAASFLVHLHTSGTRQPSKSASIACNILGIASPIVYIAILLPIGIIAGRHYADSQRTATAIKALLAASARSWSPSTPFTLAELAPGLPLLERLVEQVEGLMGWWKAVFMFYAVSAVVLLTPISTISFLYLSSLRRAIKRTSRDLPQTSIGTTRSQKQIKHTWISLVLITSAFSLLATIFFIVSIYAFLRPTSLRKDDTFQELIFTPLYAFGFLGLACAITLVVRAAEARTSDKKREGRTRREKDIASGQGTTSSGCLSTLWNGSGQSRSKTTTEGTDETFGRQGRRGEPHRDGNESRSISFGEMLRGFAKSSAGKREAGLRSEAGVVGLDSRGSRSARRREESTGVGSSVVVNVEVEVREDGGDAYEEQELERKLEGVEERFDRI